MIEFFVIFAVLFLIAVLFYKQRRGDLQILQMEHEQMSDQFAELLSEQQLLVIRGVQPPRGLTAAALEKIPRLASFPVGGQPLGSVLANPQLLSSAGGLPVLNTENRQLLATELAVPIWAQKTWQEPLASAHWLGYTLGTLRTEALIGGLGLFRTSAYATVLLPTDGTYKVSVVSKDAEDFLPPAWEYRYVSTFTPNDTPLVAELKYLEIVLRPGTALVIPKHTVLALEPTDAAFHAGAIVEFHLPVSMLAKSFGSDGPAAPAAQPAPVNPQN
jgi:hypothetical protein